MTRIAEHSRTLLASSALLASVLLCCLEALALPTAHAGHFSGATWGTGCTALNQAGNATHSFFYTAAVPQYMRNAINAVRSESYDPTDINTVTSTEVNSGTDVVVYQQNYTDWCGVRWHPSGGAIGHTQCVSLVASNGRCQKHENRYDESFVAGASTATRKHLACHESGHTLGLGHRVSSANSCMWTGAWVTGIDQHDRDAINAHY